MHMGEDCTLISGLFMAPDVPGPDGVRALRSNLPRGLMMGLLDLQSTEEPILPIMPSYASRLRNLEVGVTGFNCSVDAVS